MMAIQKRKVLFNQNELVKVIEFTKTKKIISLGDLTREFDKEYPWALDVMETLEMLSIVDVFKGEINRKVLLRTNSK